MHLAIALYNNDVDDEDELEFRKGDILTVLIENPNGLNGWWLCEHKGKCGLCPGNRLKLISNTPSSEPQRSSSSLSTASVRSNSSIKLIISSSSLLFRCTIVYQMIMTFPSQHQHQTITIMIYHKAQVGA